MNILALETSTDACSVALLREDGEAFSRFELTPRAHTRYLQPMLDAVLQSAAIERGDLDFIAYASGPGAFTGVRIAAASAQGLALGLGIPLLAVSTLAVMAQDAFDRFAEPNIIAALDAHMGEAYWGRYRGAEDGLVSLDAEEKLVPLQQLELPADCIGVGSAFSACIDAGNHIDAPGRLHPELSPAASALLKLAARAAEQGNQFAVGDTQINYLRNQVAEKKKSPALVF